MKRIPIINDRTSGPADAAHGSSDMKYFTSRAYPVLFILSAFCLSAVWFASCYVSTAQAATVPATSGPSFGPRIQGTLRDGTPDYSERQFKLFERVVAQADAEKGPDKAFTDALTQLIGPHGPMPGVTVTLRKKSTTPEAREFLLKTVTDSQGKFNFSDVREGEYTVTAEIRRGWLAGRTEVQRQVKHDRRRDRVDLVYHPNLVIVKGKITDTSGRPLASVKVTATQCNNDVDSSDYIDSGEITVHSHVVSAVSDRDGSYELRGLIPANAWEAAPFMTGGSGYAHDKYNIHAELEGYVMAEVKIPIVPEEVRTAAQRLMRILLERGGQEGKARLAAMKPASLPSCQGNTITGIDFVLTSSSLLSGKVIDSQNKPQPACYVWLVPVKDAPTPIATNALLPKPVSTDAQGAFEFHGVPAGSYTFRIGKDNRSVNVEVARVTVREGEATTGLQLKFDAQPLGRIEATVCEMETGKPIADFAASVWQVVNPREYYSAKGELRKNSAGSGTFTVEKISPGNVELEITAPGHAPEHLHIDVPPGQTTLLRVWMAKAGVARIRVTQDGASVQHTEGLEAFSVETGSITYGSNAPKDGGWYEIPGLKAGRYKIRVHVFNGKYARYETVPVVIEADKTSDVTFDLGGSSGLTLILAFASGLTAQAWVEASDASVGQRIGKNLDLCTYLFAKSPGDYAFEHLRPGTYRVGVRLIDPAKGQKTKDELVPEQSQTVTLHEGQTSSVQFRF